MGASVIVLVFLVCVFSTVPIGYAIGLSVVAYALFGGGSINMGYIASGLFASCDSFPLMAIPFFILSGALMEGGGLSRRLVLFFDSIVGHLTGGLAIEDPLLFLLGALALCFTGGGKYAVTKGNLFS